MEIITLDDEQKKYISGWSWGSMFLGFFWALGSKIYLYAILMFVASLVPIVNLVSSLYFGVAGRRLAWQNAKWESFDAFKKRQRLLDRIGWIVLVISVLVAGYAIERYVVPTLLIYRSI